MSRLVRCARTQLEMICRRLGSELDDVLPCVIEQDGDIWTIDIDNPACGIFLKPIASHPPSSMPSRDAPGFLEKVKNFAVAAAQHVAAGMPMASDEEIIRRHDICLACEFLADGACTQCGCPISRVAGYVSKLSWADQECPVGKWGKSPPS